MVRVLGRSNPDTGASLGRAIPKARSSAPLSLPASRQDASLKGRACMCEPVRNGLRALRGCGLRSSGAAGPAQGGGQGPRGGAGRCSGPCMAGDGRSPVPREPPREVALAPPSPKRPSAGTHDAGSAPRDPGKGAAHASASAVGTRGRPGGWAKAAPPPSAEPVETKLCKQKDSDYLSGAGASSSAVRLPGAGRVFSSRKAGGARALAPERRPRRLRRERQPLGKERAGLSHKRHVCGAKWEGGLEEPLYMAIGSRIEKEFFFKVAKTGKLAPRGREMSLFYNLHTFYKYFSVFKKTFED